MSHWQRCNRNFPCPICKHEQSDGCSVGEKFAVCIRVESAKPSSLGWLHKLTDDVPRPKLPTRKQSAPERILDADALMQKWERATRFEWVEKLADDLGVNVGSLYDLNCVYAPEYSAFAFPMRNEHGKVVGIRLRNEFKKWAVKGSKSGLFFKSFAFKNWNFHDTIYFTEGPTDTAALLSLGVFAVGRSNCMADVETSARLVHRLRARRVVIFSNNDSDECKYTHDDKIRNPGIDGSKVLQAAMPVPCCIVVPPAKDARAFLNDGGTRIVLENLVNKAINWTRLK